VRHGFLHYSAARSRTKTSCYPVATDAANTILGRRISSLGAGFPTLKKNFQNGIRLLTTWGPIHIIRRVWVVGG